jgi:glycosyltransferase involved in cell wall biosynthesis
MKKIIVSSNSCWNIYNFRLNFIKKLLENNYSVYILSNIDHTSNELEKIGCNILPISFSRKKKSFYEIFYLIYKYYYFFLKIKPKIYFSFTIKPNLIGGLVANTFNVNSIINFTGLGTLVLKKNFLNTLITYLFKILLKKSSKVFFHNHNDLRILKSQNILKNFNYEVIPGSGVDLSKFKYYPYIKSSNINFLFIGRIIEDKGVIELINAAEIIKKKFNNINFLAIGDFDKDNISNISPTKLSKINNLNLVKFIGFKENIINYIIKSSCIVLPSYREGLSKSLLEACSIGRPIVATDVPGCREIVKHNYNGFLCESKNFLDLANSLEKFIKLSDSDKLIFGRRSRIIVEKNYDEKCVISRYMKEIEKYV